MSILGSFLKNISTTSFFCQQQDVKLNFWSEMEEAIESKSTETKARKEEAYVNRKKRKHNRMNEKLKKRTWHEAEDEEAKRIRLEAGEERVRRKKCVLLISYSGVKYSGMQKNPGANTIEEELLKAMLKQKWITQAAYELPQIQMFQRAARTDKGVSACRQIVSVKIPENVDLDAINADLPEDIKIFGVQRVTKSFNSKENCDARTYSYTLPTYALSRKDETFDEKSFRLSPERLEELNKILSLYEGTKNYHNFTIRKEANDPSNRRFIMKFECPTPFVPDNTEVEFARLKVKGQSFMMHQIRRMVGLAIAIMRGHVEPYVIAHAFEKERFPVPQAPGLGLVLEQTHYDRYNKRYGGDGQHECIEFDKEEPLVEKFFQEKIMSTIIKTELSERPMLAWIKGLRHHSFIDVPDPEKKKGEEEEETGNTSD